MLQIQLIKSNKTKASVLHIKCLKLTYLNLRHYLTKQTDTDRREKIWKFENKKNHTSHIWSDPCLWGANTEALSSAFASLTTAARWPCVEAETPTSESGAALDSLLSNYCRTNRARRARGGSPAPPPPSPSPSLISRDKDRYYALAWSELCVNRTATCTVVSINAIQGGGGFNH